MITFERLSDPCNKNYGSSVLFTTYILVAVCYGRISRFNKGIVMYLHFQ